MGGRGRGRNVAAGHLGRPEHAVGLHRQGRRPGLVLGPHHRMGDVGGIEQGHGLVAAALGGHGHGGRPQAVHGVEGGHVGKARLHEQGHPVAGAHREAALQAPGEAVYQVEEGRVGGAGAVVVHHGVVVGVAPGALLQGRVERAGRTGPATLAVTAYDEVVRE